MSKEDLLKIYLGDGEFFKAAAHPPPAACHPSIHQSIQGLKEVEPDGGPDGVVLSATLLRCLLQELDTNEDGGVTKEASALKLLP